MILKTFDEKLREVEFQFFIKLLKTGNYKDAGKLLYCMVGRVDVKIKEVNFKKEDRKTYGKAGMWTLLYRQIEELHMKEISQDINRRFAALKNAQQAIDKVEQTKQEIKQAKEELNKAQKSLNVYVSLLREIAEDVRGAELYDRLAQAAVDRDLSEDIKKQFPPEENGSQKIRDKINEKMKEGLLQSFMPFLYKTADDLVLAHRRNLLQETISVACG